MVNIDKVFSPKGYIDFRARAKRIAFGDKWKVDTEFFVLYTSHQKRKRVMKKLYRRMSVIRTQCSSNKGLIGLPLRGNRSHQLIIIEAIVIPGQITHSA